MAVIEKNLKFNTLPNEGDFIYCGGKTYFFTCDEGSTLCHLWQIEYYKAIVIETFGSKVDVFRNSPLDFSNAYYYGDSNQQIRLTSPDVVYYRQGDRFTCKKYPNHDLLLVRVSTEKLQLIDIKTANRFGTPIPHDRDHNITDEQLEKHNSYGEFTKC